MYGKSIFHIWKDYICVLAQIGLDEGEVNKEVDGTKVFNVSRDIDTLLTTIEVKVSCP